VQELRQLRRGRVSGGQQVEVLVQCAKARGVVSIDVFGAEVGLNSRAAWSSSLLASPLPGR